jgi:hypothetical protein
VIRRIIAVVGVLGAPLSAAASPCGAADFLTALPRDGASSVPTNATLTAHYAAPASYDGETIHVEHAPVSGGADLPREPPRDVTGDFDANEGLLALSFDEPLVAGDEYTVTWPRLRGEDHSGQGKGGKVSFRVGSAADMDFPTFGGLSSIAWDVVRERDDCTDSLEDRFAFDLGLRSAGDDGGRDSLELVVYQSKGQRAAGDEVLHVPIPPKGETVRAERALGDATGRTCFSAIVRDLTGRAAGGDAAGVCTTTVPPPFFYGCRVARRKAPGNDPLTAALVLVAAALFARRRRTLEP